jgi:hypothetical protein
LVANNQHTDFKFLFRPTQIKLYDTIQSITKTRRHVGCIGRRWGKSTFGWLYLAQKAYQKANSHFLFLAPVNEKLDSYLAKVVDQILIFCPKDVAPAYKNGKYIFFNGSTIECFGTTNESFLYIKGQRFDGIYADEIGEMDDLQSIINDILSPTIFDSQGFLLCFSAPGETPDHYFKTLCEEAQLGGYYSHFTIYDAGYDAAWILQELQDVAKGDPKNTTWRRQYLGEFATESTRMVLNTWISDKYVKIIPKVASFPYFYHYVSWDPGFRDPNALTFSTYLWDIKTLYIEDEIVIPGKDITPDKLAEQIKAKVKELWGESERVAYWADPSNQTILDIVAKNYKLYFGWTAKDKKEQALEELRTFIQDGRLILHPRCVIHKLMFENTIWDKTHKDFERSNSGHHGDCVDSTLYTFRNVNFENPLPAVPPMNVEKEFITPSNKSQLEEQEGIEDWVTRPPDDTMYHQY